MRFVIEPPSLQEALSVNEEERQFTVSPIVIKNNPMVKVGHLTAIGDGKAESKATIYFNGRTGTFSIVAADAEPPVFAFDKPKKEFEISRDSMKRNGIRMHAKKTKKRFGDTTNEEADQDLRGDTLVREDISGSVQRASAGADSGESAP